MPSDITIFLYVEAPERGLLIFHDVYIEKRSQRKKLIDLAGTIHRPTLVREKGFCDWHPPLGFHG